MQKNSYDWQLLLALLCIPRIPVGKRANVRNISMKIETLLNSKCCCYFHTKEFFHAVVLCVFILPMSACVTTQTGGLPKYSKEGAVQAKVDVARQYIKIENYERARFHLQQALQLDRNNAQAYEVTALVFQATGEHKLAEENFVMALRLDNKDSRIHNNYGNFLYQQKRYPEAVKEFSKVINDTLYPGRDKAFGYLGVAALNAGDEQLASRVFQLAANNKVKLPFVYFHLAGFKYNEGAFQDGYRLMQFYRRLSAYTPESAWLAYRLAEKVGDEDQQASLDLLIRKQFHQSPEFHELMRSKGDEL